MAGSIFGDIFTVSTWGESHGKALGAVIDGCPAGLRLDEKDFEEAMARRRPGQTKYATPRSEEDRIELLSGVFEGRTTGTPISLMIRNTSQRSGDYGDLARVYRPGHADYSFDAKYGFRDYRGGGRSSGRETAARVAAGVIAERILGELGVCTTAYVRQIGPHECRENIYGVPGDGSSDGRERTETGTDSPRADRPFVPARSRIERSPLRMPDSAVSARAEQYLGELMEQGDSAGGVIECIVTGLPAGIGDPVFDKLDARLGQALFSIGAVKGVEIGVGFAAAESRGSENNDEFVPADARGAEQDEGRTPAPGRSVSKSGNHAGGILGGISDGDDIVIRAAFKPTPSISRPQKTVDADGNGLTIEVKGRHDPVIVPRAVVVVESMVNLVLTDCLMKGMTSRMDRIKEFYGQA